MKKRRRRDILYLVSGVTAAVLVLGMTLSLVLTPEKAYSTRERRMLKGFPELNAETLLSGRFMDGLEDFAKDQFFARDFAADVRSGVKLLSGDRESNGVLLLKNGRLAERFVLQERTARDRMLSEVEAFSERNEGANQFFLLAPTAVWLYADEAPAFSEPGDEDVYVDLLYRLLPERMTRVDVRETFRSEKDRTELYYKTDHHWTTEGARLAAEALLKAMGLEPEFPTESGVVTKSFTGSLSAKSAFRSVGPDTLTLYRVESDPDAGRFFTVTYVDEQKMSASVYSAEALSSDDAYEVFFGGNHAEITIRTSTGTDRKLLVIKDSYANALIPFLLWNFDEITVVDPRYYQGNIDELTAEKEFTEIVFLYNANTLSQDTSLEMVLRNEQEEGKMIKKESLKYIVVLLASAVIILFTLALTMNPAARNDPEGTGAESGSPAGESVTAPEPETSSEEETEDLTEETETEEPTTEKPTTEEPTTEAPTPSETFPPAPETNEPVGIVSVSDVAFVGDSRTVFLGTATVNGVTGTGVLPDSRLFAKYGGTLTDGEAKANARAAGESGAKKVVFWLGVNDVQVNPNRGSAIEFLANYQNVVAEFLRVNRTAEIYILSVVSTSKEEKDYYEEQDENVRKYNEELKKYAERMGYFFIDLAPIDRGEENFLPDHIHFTDDYNRRLLAFLEEQVGFTR